MELSKEEKEAIEYFKRKIKNKLPLYEETYVDGKPYRRNILQLETNFTEEQANKTQTLLNLISKLQKENEKQGKVIDEMAEKIYKLKIKLELNDLLKDCFIPRGFSDIDNCVKTDCKECIKQYFYRKVERR